MDSPDDHPICGDSRFITQPPSGERGWVAAFDARAIPVLQATDSALDELREIEDAVDAHMLADTMVVDPLMTLKLLRHVSHLRRGRDQTNPETATEALVMLGITPFFSSFGSQPTVEHCLAGQPEALAGLRRVLQRAHRAARFALGFAVHRHDHDAALLHEAALLHDFAEMLLWVHAPALALDIARRQAAQPGLRSVDAQQAVLHTTLPALQQALMKAWALPPMLVQITDDHASNMPQVRNVQLAIRLARHSALGWDNPALPEDVDAIAALLNLGAAPTLQLLHGLNL